MVDFTRKKETKGPGRAGVGDAEVGRGAEVAARTVNAQTTCVCGVAANRRDRETRARVDICASFAAVVHRPPSSSPRTPRPTLAPQTFARSGCFGISFDIISTFSGARRLPRATARGRLKGAHGRFYSKKGDKKGLNGRALAMPRSDEVPGVAARTVNARTTRDGRERGADVDARARFAITPICGHAANARRLEVVERRENAVQVDAVPGGPRGTRRRRLWQRRAAVRPRTAPKTTPKRRKNWVFTPRAPRTCPRAAPAAPTAAHTSCTGRRASTSSLRPPRSPARRSRANGVDASRRPAVRREDVGASRKGAGSRSVPMRRGPG